MVHHYFMLCSEIAASWPEGSIPSTYIDTAYSLLDQIQWPNYCELATIHIK